MAKTDFIDATEMVEKLNERFEKHRDILKEILALVKELKELGFNIEIKTEKVNV